MRKLLFYLIVFALPVPVVCSGKNRPVTPETALHSYLKNGDKSFRWEVAEQTQTEGIRLYRILFTSQKWQGITWNHELIIMVPGNLKYKDALLFIEGGSVKDGKPNLQKWTDGMIMALGAIAKTNQAITALLRQVPNQPLFEGMKEDELISYTLVKFMEDHDFDWPLLFPMTKSAIRAMDVIQQFSKKEVKKKVNRFVVSGASKRGWTTWLTGACDKRVKAICPMVIDVLNMAVNIPYQKEVWGEYSVEIEDYVKRGIAQKLGNPEGSDLTTMVDPFSYRKKLTMPKMIFMGTNDPYWPADAIKNYIDEIPGENYICYTPNAGHNLGNKIKALSTLSAFFNATITGGTYTKCDYSVSEENKSITVKVGTSPQLVDAMVWSADSKDQDFRDEKWSGTLLKPAENNMVTAEISKPETGFKAFYVDVKYKTPYGQEYTHSTRVFVSDNQKLLLRNK